MKTCTTCGEKFPDDANFCPMDAQKLVPLPAAAPAPAPPAGATGPINGRFALGPSLGGGASGEVFRAKDQQTNAQVAVKLINPAVLPSPIAVERASRELRQLARVQSERIARIIDFGKTQDGRLYVATDLVEGESLDKIVGKNGALTLGRARNLTLQIGEALTEAQKAGVIHRDVAPKNVLVLPGDKVRVINFSVPRPVSDKVFGVPEFLSPEQAEGRSVDQRSNIYSLGAILYYLATGKPPFEGADAKAVCELQLKGTVAMPSSKKPGLPAELDRLVAKALEKSSSRRHLTLRQLLSEIEALPADGAVAPDQSRAHTMYAAGGVPSVTATTTPVPPPAAAAPPPRHTSPVAVAQTMMAPATAQMTPVAPQPVAPQPAPPPPQRTSVSQAGSLGGGAAPTKTVSVNQAAPPAAVNPPAPAPAATPGKPAAFRETLWFKKGEVDQFMQQQAQQPGQPAPEAPAEDIRPIEDRYKDDGTVSAQDREKFSLRTGQTMFGQRVQIPSGAAVPGERMSEDEMMAEIHTGRRVGLWVAVGLGLVILAAAGWFLFLRKPQPAPTPAPVAASPQPAPTPAPTPPSPEPAAAAPTPAPAAAAPEEKAAEEPAPAPAKKKHHAPPPKKKRKGGW